MSWKSFRFDTISHSSLSKVAHEIMQSFELSWQRRGASLHGDAPQPQLIELDADAMRWVAAWTIMDRWAAKEENLNH